MIVRRPAPAGKYITQFTAPDGEIYRAEHNVKRRAVIFDWGGVLMRTEDRRPRLAWDRRLGFQPGTVESAVHGIAAWEKAQLGQTEVGAYWQAVGDGLGLDAAQLQELRRSFYSGDRLDRELVRLIGGLRARGVLIGLLSNNSPDLHDTLAGLGLDSLFDARVISADIGVMKPHPAAYWAVLERLGVAPEASAFIDDSAVNVQGAVEVGMQAIQFVPGMALRERLETWLDGAAG